MPYGARRRFRRRVRRVRRRPSSARRRYSTFRKTYRKFRKTVTGVGPRKTLKVRKEFTWNINPEIPGPGVSYNQIMVGCAQVANAHGWMKFQGNATTGIGPAVGLDPTASTGLAQWFAFYGRYVVHASKIKVELFAPYPLMQDTRGIAVTLVPTVGYNLGYGGSGGNPFDSQNIDPAELPYARKILLPTGGEPNNSSTRKMSHYVSVKKMLNIKDINDVLSVPGVATQHAEDPFVPAIIDNSDSYIIQPIAVNNQVNGIYWNIVFQEIGKNQDPAPTQPFHGGVSMRIIQTSYIQFSDRKPLTTTF